VKPDRIFDPIETMIPPAQRVYSGWRRVPDVAHGYGFLLASSRKTPDGETPSLVRFGTDLGKVSMLNAGGSETFPGKGFAVHSLETARILAVDKNVLKFRAGPLHVYKSARPGHAEEIDDFHLSS